MKVPALLTSSSNDRQSVTRRKLPQCLIGVPRLASNRAVGDENCSAAVGGQHTGHLIEARAKLLGPFCRRIGASISGKLAVRAYLVSFEVPRVEL